MDSITVNYGKNYLQTVYEALKASDILQHLDPGMAVAIKPNLVVPKPASYGATTHPEVVEGIIVFLREAGVEKISIIESSWVGASTKDAFEACGYERLSSQYGVALVDLKGSTATQASIEGEKILVCNEALHADFLINVPVLKAHCQTLMTCCMKNLKGCIPDSEKRKFHRKGLHRQVALLNAVLKTGYCIVDGICGDLSFEEGGNPIEANRIIAGANPLLIDSYCAGLIGYTPDEIGYLAIGEELGLGELYSSATRITELNTDEKPIWDAKASKGFESYKRYINEDSACSACYSSLIFALHKMGRRMPSEKIHIGQGFKGKQGAGIGVGNCASGFGKCAPGCPPTAAGIIDMLR
ncbi:MAG: DUF362 domain-containing protein [Eubacteriaceae bacterium]|nr:DUF362 domain-containing protein [Eubacteriaceae bacterium]